ncbi:MAG: M14 family zinc carboxypeptidase, partial [bacterium]
MLKVFVKNQDDAKNIMREGLFIDHAESHEGEYIEVWLSDAEIEKLNRSGVPYEIVINDFEKYYNDLPKMTSAEMTDAIQKSIQENNVSHSIYGTMGGYLTLDQVISKLDSMRTEYPGLISAKFSIGNSVESRPMWTVRVSNSPNATTGRPEVWFHSLIHAREPMSMEQNIYFMYWLLENYNVDPIATYLMNNREFYFTPVFNPDGYEYNRSTNPTGGGFWRKNRKVNTGGSFGVDLNRNYGIYAFWNSTNNGSSTISTDDTYRGTSPFSEPETQNARDFVISRNFKGILSYHTYGNYLIRPWGYVDAPSPDENIYQSLSQEMVLNNHFTLGRSNQTVAYGVRGVTDDWYYSDSAHNSAIAMTPEVGTSTDGFWPAQARILPLAKITLSQNITFALSCGPYVAPVKTNLNKEQYAQGEAGSLKVYFKNKGLMNAQNVRVELTSQSPLLNIQTTSFSYPNIGSFVSDSLTFNFTVSSATPVNSAIKASLKVKLDNSNVVYVQDISIPVGGGNILLLDSAENGITNWTVSAGWATTTTQSYSPTRSFTDSPTGNYSNSANRTMTLNTALNVSANPIVLLSFWYKHNIDTLDNAYVDVSNDNGVSWESVRFYNKIVNDWTKEVIDISSIANSTTSLKIRFSMVSNGTVVADGIYIDDIKLAGYNATPTGIVSNTGIPEKYSLSQNYPNPFNPTTNINYSLPASQNTLLRIYDLLGKEVMTLVNEKQNAGNYSVSFDGSNLSSGLYYYKLESGEFTDTKKMLLIK